MTPAADPAAPSILNRTRSRLREGFITWVTRRHPVTERRLRLDRRRIYILPTVYGYYFALTVLLMLLGALNYNNSMAFMLTFLLAGLGANSMWQTHRNLLGLSLEAGVPGPVFAGDTARFPLRVRGAGRHPQRAIAVRWPGAATFDLLDAAPNQDTAATLYVAAPNRGLLAPGRFVVSTRYPLGLFQAWTWIEFDWRALVYPAPASALEPGTGHRRAGDHTPLPDTGNEDFIGMRRHQDGDAPGRVAWKALARSDTLLSKLFTATGDEEIWLDWDALPAVDTERRLSILCAMVLAAARRDLRYGMRLPDREFAPAVGEHQMHRCLEALALFPHPGAPGSRSWGGR